MKIYNSMTIDIKTGKILSEDSYDYDGYIAECKKGGGVQTKTVQSKEAEQALAAVMPALERIGQMGGVGQPLYDVPGAPIERAMGYFGGVVPPQYQPPSVTGLMPSAASLGAISPEIKEAVAGPYLEAMGQVTEQFGGGMGSARGGLSGAGAEVLNRGMESMIPQYTQQLWGMVAPALAQGYQADLGARQAEWQAQTAANLAQAQTGTELARQEWAAEVAARQAPFGPITEIAGGTMPTTIGGTTKK